MSCGEDGRNGVRGAGGVIGLDDMRRILKGKKNNDKVRTDGLRRIIVFH